jgi:hypothetical protein
MLCPSTSGPLVAEAAHDLGPHECERWQLVSLERKTLSVRERVDHPVGMHDDLVNASDGAIVMAQQDRATASNKPSRIILK